MSTRRGRGSRGRRGSHVTIPDTEPEIQPAADQQAGEPTLHTVTTALVHNTEDEIQELGDNLPVPKTRAPRGRGKKATAAASKRPTVSSLSLVVAGLQDSSKTQAHVMANLDKRVTDSNHAMDRKLDNQAHIMANLDKRVTDSNEAMDQKLDRVLAALVAIESKTPQNSNHANTVSSVVATPPPQPPRRDSQPVASRSNGSHADAATAAAPRSPAAAQPGRHGMPAPADMARQENRDGYIDSLLAREDYAGESTQGKTPCTSDNVFMKPYMFIEREGIQTTRQKLELRSSLSMVEYMSCSLALLQDKDAYSEGDLHDIIKHLGAVAIDAMVQPWPNVRRWSQHIWDLVERGKCRWSDYQAIQDERFRISYMNLPQQGGSGPQSGTSVRASSSTPVNVSTAICRDFNNISGCRYSASHEEGSVKYAHVCAHCDSIGKKSSHPYHKCRSRMDGGGHQAAGGDSHYDHRQWYNGGRHNYRNQHGQGHGRGSHSGSHQSHDTGSKNG